jgi:hypothetical protein
VLREGNPYAQARALNSVNVLNASQMQFGDYAANESYQTEARRNAAAVREVQIAAGKVQQSLQETERFDNRDRLRRQVEGQTNFFAKNVVQGLESNFKADRASARGESAALRADAGGFNSLWLDRSELRNDAAIVAGEKAGKPSDPSLESKSKERIAVGKQAALGRDKAGVTLQSPGVSQKKTPALLDGRQLAEARGRPAETVADAEGGGQRQAVARYQARHMQQQQVFGRVVEESEQQPAASGEPARGIAAGVADGSVHFDQFVTPAKPAPADAPAQGQPPQSGQAAPLPAGLASLNVEIPFRGREYRFTTPQGDVQIIGHAVATRSIFGTAQALIVLLFLAVAAYVIILGSRGRFNWWLGRTGSTCLIVLGLLAFLFLPVLGLLAAVGGVMIKANLAMARRERCESPFAARQS